MIMIYEVIYIYAQQLSVSIALYNVPWWRSDKKVRKLVTLMILRSIKPIYITGLYMYKLSFESFISVRLHSLTIYMLNLSDIFM